MSESVCVSVIIITYNQRQFIEQAVSSVLMQRTNFPFEILIGDDASTDGTVEILKALQEKRRRASLSRKSTTTQGILAGQ